LVITSVIENRPLLILLSGFFLVSISYGFYIGLLFILADSYLGIGKQLPLIFVVSGIAGLGAAFMVYHLSTYCKKLTIYIISILLTATALVGHAFLAPGPSVFVPLTLLVSMIYFGNAMVLIIVPSLLSDIVDYGTLKFGSDRAATYFSVYFFMVKALGGVGSACGLAIIAWYNFDASALTHNQESVFGLHLAIAYLPTLMLLVSLFLIVKTPINAHRHHIIQKRLTQRRQRQARELNTSVTNPLINT